MSDWYRITKDRCTMVSYEISEIPVEMCISAQATSVAAFVQTCFSTCGGNKPNNLCPEVNCG